MFKLIQSMDQLGGKSAPEIALSIIAQLVAETYKK